MDSRQGIASMGEKGHFHLGQVVQHRLFGYRGVIIDVDPEFSLSDNWYEKVAKNNPPRHKPWFRILVHNTAYETYEAQENLLPESDPDKINHPDIREHFKGYNNGRYVPGIQIN